MLVTSTKKAEPVKIPVRGSTSRKRESIVKTIPSLRVRLKSSHR